MPDDTAVSTSAAEATADADGAAATCETAAPNPAVVTLDPVMAVPEAAAGTVHTQLGLIEHLLADLHTLRDRDDELHQRLLEQIERRHAAEAARHAERFKSAALQRDIELVQLRLKSVHASLETVTQERHDFEALERSRGDEVHQRLLDQTERRHAAEAALHAERFKSAALQRDLELVQLRLKSVHASLEAVTQERNELDRSLRDIRASIMWRVGKIYWSVSRKIGGR